MNDPVDASAPWTIKAVSTATREAVTKAARREGMTVGQWLEKRVAEWEADGSPVHVGPIASDLVSNLDKLASTLSGMGAAGLPIPKGHVARVTGALLREAGLSVRRPDAAPELARLPAPDEAPSTAGQEAAPKPPRRRARKPD